MLRVVYEAATDLEAGRAELTEHRGLVVVKVRQGSDVEEYTEALNNEVKRFLDQCGWFQIWRGRVISAQSPNSPLRVEYVPDDQIDRRKCVEVRESCGLVKVHVASCASVDDFLGAINPASERFLAGGQWFQLWQGEIITMDSPGSAAA